MAGSGNKSVGRLAALAAADRVKLLLTVVEDDEFLSEVLHSADRTMVRMDTAQGDSAQVSGPARPQRRAERARPALLGPTYHDAKKRALRLRRAIETARGRPTGRA